MVQQLIAIVSLLAFSFAGGIVWLFNVEAAAMVAGASGDWHPLTVGLVCTSGQCLAYTFLYYGGDWIFARWRWAGRQVVRTRDKYGDRLGRGFLLLTVPAALIGLPPMTGMAALAGGFRVRLVHLIGIAFAFRLIRFTVLAAVGTQLVGWWQRLW